MTAGTSAQDEERDAVLVGGGVMSATLGVLLAEAQPDWRIAVVERLDEAGCESSAAWNNAGTGHAGLCEFTHMPRRPHLESRIVHDSTAALDGSISAEHALGQAQPDVIADYRSPLELELMRGVKQVLDRAELRNSGTVLPG